MNICVDSNSVTYLLQAINNYSPENDDPILRDERIAMIRVLFYIERKLKIPPSVKEEINAIRDIDNWLHHKIIEEFLDMSDWGIDQQQLLNRKNYFKQYHNKDKDCQVLAEAELAGMNYLLSFDKEFVNNLCQRALGVRIATPSNFVSSFNLQPGSKPKIRPEASNPLFKQNWWKI